MMCNEVELATWCMFLYVCVHVCIMHVRGVICVSKVHVCAWIFGVRQFEQALACMYIDVMHKISTDTFC